MQIGDIPLFGMLRVKLGWLSDRQRVLAENVANANSADYKAKDLKELSFDDLLGRAKALRDSSHDGTQGRVRLRATSLDFTPRVDRAAEETPNGNSVDLEAEMMKVAQTQTEYQAAIDVYKKSAGLLRLAIGR